MTKTVLLIMPILLCRCSSLETSVGLGAGIGGTTGLVAGHAANFNMKGLALTTLTGAAFGGLFGYLIHKRSETDKPSEKGEVALSSLQPTGDEPILKEAEKEILWIPGAIQGERYSEPHRVFIIKKPSHWTLPEENEVNNEKPGKRTKRENKIPAN